MPIIRRPLDRDIIRWIHVHLLECAAHRSMAAGKLAGLQHGRIARHRGSAGCANSDGFRVASWRLASRAATEHRPQELEHFSFSSWPVRPRLSTLGPAGGWLFVERLSPDQIPWLQAKWLKISRMLPTNAVSSTARRKTVGSCISLWNKMNESTSGRCDRSKFSKGRLKQDAQSCLPWLVDLATAGFGALDLPRAVVSDPAISVEAWRLKRRSAQVSLVDTQHSRRRGLQLPPSCLLRTVYRPSTRALCSRERSWPITAEQATLFPRLVHPRQSRQFHAILIPDEPFWLGKSPR